MTGFLWRSAFVAAVFAIHPLRVESVAWVAERKDVLSAVFFMLTLGAYMRYARKPFSYGRYLAVALFLTLGLMSKPSPGDGAVVLLLLDYWPLQRLAAGGPGLRRLLLEKIPLLGLWRRFVCHHCFAQKDAIRDMDHLPMPLRVGNALVTYITYLGQMFYPANLVTFYPHPANRLPLWEAGLAFMLLLAISAAAFAWRRDRPGCWWDGCGISACWCR